MNNQPEHSAVKVALDAMGGDFAPMETVKAAVHASQHNNVHIKLVGEEKLLNNELSKYDVEGLAIDVIPSEGRIEEGDQPILALRQKPSASIAIATRLVKEGAADALVSMGSTGATMACSALMLGLFGGLGRPAMGGNFHGLAPKTVVMDMGSIVDARPAQLLSCAILGQVFSNQYLEIPNPRIAILSIGSEEGKGNRLTKESFELFKSSSLNFVGNVEGMDLFANKADVIVCDGFIGNILLKFTHGVGIALSKFLEKRLDGLITTDKINELTQEILEINNAARRIGGPLFGVNHPVIVGHGSSNATGISGAISTAIRVVDLKLIDSMKKTMSKLNSDEKTT